MRNLLPVRVGSILTVAAISLVLAGNFAGGAARAASETPICDFTGGDGGEPMTGVVRDRAAEKAGIVPAGTLFGTTAEGGKFAPSQKGGTLFMLTPPAASGNAWTLTVLHSFDPQPASGDGYFPFADLTADANGNLYGTAEFGGSYA